jgi:hypothetical protein
MDYPDDRHKRRQYMDLGGVGGGTHKNPAIFLKFMLPEEAQTRPKSWLKKQGRIFTPPTSTSLVADTPCP